LVPQAEYPDLIAGADISIVALEERIAGLGVPSKFYNILASGRPVLALVSPDSEVARVLREEDCGTAVGYGTPDQLAQAIGALAASPERLAEMGRNARRVCEREFTLPRVAERFRLLFEQSV
jgi:colanic acid biosynthesis glycosyl transferase WcaI